MTVTSTKVASTNGGYATAAATRVASPNVVAPTGACVEVASASAPPTWTSPPNVGKTKRTKP